MNRPLRQGSIGSTLCKARIQAYFRGMSSRDEVRGSRSCEGLCASGSPVKGAVMRPQDTQVQGRDPHPRPKVAIVVLNWNGWRETIEGLESVRRLIYPNYQVIVVDNGSTDGSVDQLRGWMGQKGLADDSVDELRVRPQPQDAKWVLVANPDNLGFSDGVNVGIKRALAAPSPPEYVFLLNNDARLE